MSQAVYPPPAYQPQAYSNTYSTPGAPPPGTYATPGAGPVTIVTQPQVVRTGNCPACHTGNLREEYGLVAICLAILFFPLGILCCLAMKERRCTHCRAGF